MNGYILIDRKILEWKFYTLPNALTLWILLLVKANWKDGYFHGRKIPRGSLATSIERLADSTGLSQNTVRKYLKMFEDDGQIIRERTNKYTLISIVKYDEYQSCSSTIDDQIEGQIEDQIEPNRINKTSNKYKKKIYKRKDILPKYMTEGEPNADSAELGNTEYEEIRKLLNSE